MDPMTIMMLANMLSSQGNSGSGDGTGGNGTILPVGAQLGIAGAGLAGGIIGSLADNGIRSNNPNNIALQDAVSGSTWGDVFSSGDKLAAAKNQIDNNQIDFSGVKNNDNLLNTWNPNDLQEGVQKENGWQTAGSIGGAALSDAASLATAGSTFGPVGTVIGGAAGLISGLGRGIISAFQHDSNADEINRATERANKMQIDSYYTTAQNNQAREQRKTMMNFAAFGGPLEGLNGIEHFNVGGSHGENPNGGVQQGVAQDGQPNMVEEGEIKYKDYIYSKRIKPSKALLKKNNLPEKYAGLSYAEIADKLQQESEDRPNDPISICTLDSWMERLQAAQEETRAVSAMKRAAKMISGMSDEEKMGIFAMMQGEEQPIMANGGKIHIKESKRGTFTAAAKKHGKSVQEFASQVLAHPENYSPAMRKKANFARNAAKWHEAGGYLFPEGGGLGAFDYATQYILGQTPEQEWARIIDEDRRKKGADITRMVNGNLYNAGLPIQYNVTINPDGTSSMTPMFMTNYSQVKYDGEEPRYNQVGPATKTPSSKETTISTGKGGGNDSGAGFDMSALRFAPAIGAGIGALTSLLQGRDYTYANQLRDIAGQYNPMSAPKIGGYRAYTPFDVNLGDAENLAMLATSLRSNRGQNRATQGAMDIATLGAYRKAMAERNLISQQANEARRMEVDNYNLGIDKTNASLQQAYDQLNASIKDKRLGLMASAAEAQDASDTAWAKSLSDTTTNFFNQLGNVGKDAWSGNRAMSYIAQHPELLQMLIGLV